MKLDEMIMSIIEGMEKHLNGNYEDGVTFPDEIKELIHEAADKCRQTGLYINTKNDAPERLKTGKASDLYIEMLVKTANAPTFLHAAGTPRLMLPLISDAIKREEQAMTEMNEGGKDGSSSEEDKEVHCIYERKPHLSEVFRDVGQIQ